MLGLLVAIFVAEVATGGGVGGFTGQLRGSLVQWGVMFPPAVADGEYYRLFTAMFLHASLIHLAFNGWALWIFGTFVEREFGPVRWLVIYLVGGLLGSAASYAFGSVEQASLGASGAIVALFGAFIAYNLKRRDTAISRAYLQQAIFILVINLVIGFGAGGAIDWRAHLGGLVGGFLLGGIFDAVGPFRTQAARIAGVLGVLAIVVGLVAWRTADLRSLPL